jgi:hypothetical protein
MSEPTSLRAGDTASWTRTLPDYPASAGWTLRYRLLWSTGQTEFAASADGDDYAVSLTAATTAAWADGAATLFSWVEQGADSSYQRVTIGQQPLQILPNLATAASFDGRSSAEKALADARAALQQYAANGQAHVAEYDIGGRRMTFRAAADLLRLIGQLERDVINERAALALLNGGAPPGRVYTRH